MSVRSRLLAGSLTALLVLVTVGVALSFLLFTLVAAPFLGDRLSENLGSIAARYFPLAGLLALALCGIGALWLLGLSARRLAGPLRRLGRAAAEIRDGNLGYELVISGNDEFTELAACFEQMRIRLRDSTRGQQKAEAERHGMMASICHDLKTPITSIMGYSEGILDGVASSPEMVREYAAVIRKKALSLRLLTEDLSLLSRLESAQLPLDVRPSDFGGLVDELVTDFAAEAPGITVTRELPPGLTVSVDREKIARVLVNILQNSVKYKKPEQAAPELDIVLGRLDDAALLTVSDNGMGIPASDMPYVFDEFYRSDLSRGKTGGSGLGLSIARQLVQLHGGKIWIINRPEGGVSVNITLPLHKGDDAHGKDTDRRGRQ